MEFELYMLCLHILQLSMVYINTLLMQKILIESSWISRMTIEDKRAISPLINEHITTYGEFPLDMNQELKVNIQSFSGVE